ncbi:uncharacterized protein LOC136717792 isoform X2 [Amia ocellicauda]|uniref:uncharacterized protein LOC136717792 isoform X2 n=1 Tax=Amia ocellicauda TaxID=2972642 RepID=UPI003463BA30
MVEAERGTGVGGEGNAGTDSPSRSPPLTPSPTGLISSPKRRTSGLRQSTHLVRFELPMDLCTLQGLSAMQYLCAYCRCDPPLAALFKTAFNTWDRDRDGRLSMRDTVQALQSIFVLHPTHLLRLSSLLALDPDMHPDAALFTAISALATRVLLAEPLGDAVKPDSISGRGALEAADFSGLRVKLGGLQIESTLRDLLSYLTGLPLSLTAPASPQSQPHQGPTVC